MTDQIRTVADVEARDLETATAIHEHLAAAMDPGRIVQHTIIWGKPYTWWIRDGIVRLEPRITDVPEHISVVYR